MESDEAGPDFDATKAELFEAISHPVRIRILQTLDQKPMGFAELGRAVGIESGGHLSFHMTKLRHLVKMNREGNYALTGDGKEALWSVNALQKSGDKTIGRPGDATLRHRSWLKPTLAIIVLVIITLGGFGAYQQGEFVAQQQELASQQKLLGALESGLPFTNGQSASVVIGQKNFTTNLKATSQDGLYQPYQVVFDPSGNMWVSEFSNHRVLEFEPPFSNGMKASVVIGQGIFTSSEGAISRNRFGKIYDSPCGVAFDPSGNLWVADWSNNRILEFSPPFSSGMNASVVIGQKDFTHNWYGGGGQAEKSAYADRLLGPDQPAFDSSGNLWVLDTFNNRVLEFKPPFRNGMNASLVLGQTNFLGIAASILTLVATHARCHDSLAVDPSDNVWVGTSEYNGALEFKPPFANGMNASFRIDQRNLPANMKSSGEVNAGWIIAFDRAGNLWTFFDNRYLVFKPPFIQGTRVFPSLEIGQPDFTSSVLTGGPNGLSHISGVPGFDTNGNLWVPDTGNNRILEFAAIQSAQSPSAPGPSPLDLRPLLLPVVGSAAVVASATWGVMLLRKRGLRSASTSS